MWTLLTLTFLFGGNGEEKDPKFLFFKNKTLTIALRKDQTSSLGGGEEQGRPAGKDRCPRLTERAAGSLFS